MIESRHNGISTFCVTVDHEAQDYLPYLFGIGGYTVVRRARQLPRCLPLVDFLASNTGGPMYYTGRGMAQSHKGMAISARDWDIFIGHLNDTLDAFQVPDQERSEVLAFMDITKADIVEA